MENNFVADVDIDKLDGVVVSPLGDRIIPSKHFSLCPLSKLREDEFGRNQWSISRGGSPLNDWEWTISIFQNPKENIYQDRWVVPSIIGFLFCHFEKCGEENQKRKICSAIGIN
jgi:hypothetical protein